MGYRVELIAAAERDLAEIIEHIAEHDLPERAIHVLDCIEATIEGLATEPRSCKRMPPPHSRTGSIANPDAERYPRPPVDRGGR